jgi:hypothetical protein
MLKIRKRLAIAFARDYAASLIYNTECGLLDGINLTNDELVEVQFEMVRISARIQATVNEEVLDQLCTPMNCTHQAGLGGCS